MGALNFRILPLDDPEDLVDHFGLCDTDKLEIRLDADMDPMKAAEIILHEHLHALWEERDVGYSDKQQERIVKVLSAAITAFERDNPELTKRRLQLLGVL